MIQAGLKLLDTDRSRRLFFASVLKGFYDDLLEQGVPEHLTRLVQSLDEPRPTTDGGDRKLAIVAEADEKSRALAVALLEETDLTVVDCASGEAALAVLQHRGDAVAFVFADMNLAGSYDGAKLAREASESWPAVKVVLTKDGGSDLGLDLPPNIMVLDKPWRGLDVLLAAERATSAA